VSIVSAGDRIVQNMSETEIADLLAQLVKQAEAQTQLLRSIDLRLSDVNQGIATVVDGVG